jgi:hypothetical protein
MITRMFEQFSSFCHGNEARFVYKGYVVGLSPSRYRSTLVDTGIVTDCVTVGCGRLRR